jgi:hypothetical protein
MTMNALKPNAEPLAGNTDTHRPILIVAHPAADLRVSLSSKVRSGSFSDMRKCAGDVCSCTQ